jgi:hypothetical protein
MKHSNRWMVLVLIIAGLLLSACTQTSDTPAKPEPAHVEHIEGTNLSRVVLTKKAAERIDLKTAPVLEQQVTRKRTVGAQVVDSGSGVLVRVALNASDLNRVDRGQLALVLPLARDAGVTGLAAQVVEAPIEGDPEQATAALYYAIDSAEHGLAAGQRVFIELTLLGNATQLKVIPYAAVLYDLHGETWVYTSLEPLVYVRHPIVVDYIDGDLAVLSEGPPAGTEVVMAGAAELFGAESGIGGGGH